MNLLPNHNLAVIEDSKLIEYALNPDNDRGRHKARVFDKTLGFNLDNWESFKQAIIEALAKNEATFVSETIFGIKYKVISQISGPNQQTANVLTIWQFDRQSDGSINDWPRLVTVYIP